MGSEVINTECYKNALAIKIKRWNAALLHSSISAIESIFYLVFYLQASGTQDPLRSAVNAFYGLSDNLVQRLIVLLIFKKNVFFA